MPDVLPRRAWPAGRRGADHARRFFEIVN